MMRSAMLGDVMICYAANDMGAQLGEPRSGRWGNRPGGLPLLGPLSQGSKKPSRQSLGKELSIWGWRVEIRRCESSPVS
eukprot:5081553-Pyramimonas_sp.AAC.1